MHLLFFFFFLYNTLSQTPNQVIVRNGPCLQDNMHCQFGLYEMAQDEVGDFYASDMTKSLKKWNGKSKSMVWSLTFPYAIRAFDIKKDVLTAGGTQWIHLINATSGVIFRNISVPSASSISELVVENALIYVGFFQRAGVSKFHTNGTNLANYGTGSVYVLALRINGPHIYIGGSGAGNITILDKSNGALIQTFTAHSSYIYSILFTNNGYFFTASDDKTIKKWDSVTFELLDELKDHTDSVLTLAMDQNGLYSGSKDDTIIQWNPYTGTVLNVLSGHGNSITRLIAKNGVVLSGSYDGTIRQWQPKHPDFIASYTLTSDRPASFDYLVRKDHLLYIASKSHGILSWNTNTIAFSTIVSNQNIQGQVNCLEYLDDYVLAGSTNGNIYGWGTKGLLSLRGHSLSVTTLTIGKSSNELISTSLDGKVIKWDISSGTNVKTFDGFGAIYSMFLNGNELYLGLNGAIKVIHVDTGLLLGSLGAFEGPVQSLYVNDLVLFVGDSQGRIRKWDIHTLESLDVSEGLHTDGITDISFDSNQRLFTASADSSIIEWNPVSLQPLKKWFGHAAKISGISGTGSYIYSISVDGTLIKWRCL